MLNVTAEQKAIVREKVADLILLANTKLGADVPVPVVKYTKRGTVAGTAEIGQNAINLNAVLLVENFDDFLVSTIPHEVAHMIDYALHPENFEVGYGQKRSVHGPTWKRIMRAIGANPSRCHSYDTSNSKVKRQNNKQSFVWVGTCGCEMTLGPKRHKNMLSGNRRYFVRGHRGCDYTHKQDDGATARPMKRSEDPTLTKAQRDALKSFEEFSKPGGEYERSLWKDVSKTSGSMKDRAAKVYKQAGGQRGVFIELCEIDLGMKRSTASSYHHNFKSGKWPIDQAA